MKKKFENILLIAGCGQNVGKTTLVCQILQNEKKNKPVAVKISPHFHTQTPGLVEIQKSENWILFEETNNTTQKDSSLFLQNRAVKSYLIQTADQGLEEAFTVLKKYLPSENPVIIESASLIKSIKPGFFIVVLPEGECKKKEVKNVLHKADLIIISNGKKFNPSPEKITFKKTWFFE